MSKLDVNGRPEINLGDELTCCVTGKKFIAQQVGCTTNYARDAKNNVYSDEGVDIKEKEDLKDRSKPFYCYLSSDGNHVTGWKGNKLGRVTQSGTSRNGFHGSEIVNVRVVDIHGMPWHGKGGGFGMCITLRPSKHFK